MQRRVVWYVVEYSTKHMIVGQLKDGAGDLLATSKEKGELLTVHII